MHSDRTHRHHSQPSNHNPGLLGERLVTLAEAGQSLPGSRGNAHVTASTVFRWVTRGCTALDGARVRLEAARVGGRWVTSREALARFSTALSASTPPETPRPPAEVRRAAGAAADELTRLGI